MTLRLPVQVTLYHNLEHGPASVPTVFLLMGQEEVRRLKTPECLGCQHMNRLVPRRHARGLLRCQLHNGMPFLPPVYPRGFVFGRRRLRRDDGFGEPQPQFRDQTDDFLV